jgi:hypothetical protein
MNLDPTTAPSTPLFTDVSTSDFGFQSIQLMAEKGLMSPCETGACVMERFCPNDSMTRGQAASVLAKEILLR